MRKGNPWISISDLLSSVVLVLLLLFVMASIIPKYNQENQRRLMMTQIDQTLKEYQDSGQVRVNTDTGILEFTSVTFDSGSAVLTPVTINIIQQLATKLKDYMDHNAMMELLIEGHTDPSPVATNRLVDRGGYFQNNIQLSTLRATNVRETLLKFMGKEYAGRIGAAGYGETRLKNVENPMSPENRRIELRIVWNGKSEE